MNDEINYKNSPLHGLSLKKMLIELTDHYGFDILFAYLTINCFKTNPSVASSVKFLKKTDWAREKVEGFYLYSYKNLPKASYQQYQLSPRDRIIPDDQSVGEPAILSLEDAERLRELREARAAEFDSKPGVRKGQHTGTKQDVKRARSQGSNSQGGNLQGGKSQGGNAQGNNAQDNNSPADKRKPTTSRKRIASTPDNPWGLPRT